MFPMQNALAIVMAVTVVMVVTVVTTAIVATIAIRTVRATVPADGWNGLFSSYISPGTVTVIASIVT